MTIARPLTIITSETSGTRNIRENETARPMSGAGTSKGLWNGATYYLGPREPAMRCISDEYSCIHSSTLTGSKRPRDRSCCDSSIQLRLRLRLVPVRPRRDVLELRLE